MTTDASDSEVAIDVSEANPGWTAALPEAAAICRSAAAAALAAALAERLGTALRGGELSIVLGDDALLRGLNRAWRRRDAATNVLSFPAQEFGDGAPEAPEPGAPLPLGDVVLALETIRREAAEQGKTLAAHLAHLVVHGVLHLFGYDHLAEGEAEHMEALERRVLNGLGIGDPYALPAVEPGHG